MRPRKTVLVVGGEHGLMGRLAFVLDVKGFRVRPAADLAEAWAAIHGGGVDVVLADLAFSGLESLLSEARRCPPVRTLVVDAHGILDERTPARMPPADAFLAKRSSSPVEVIERVRLLTAKKRGPKPTPAQGSPLLEAV